MFKDINQPVHSEYRYYQSPVRNQNKQWFNPYVSQNHVTSASHQNNQKHFTHNTIRVTIKNSSTGSFPLRKNRPIPGIVVHDIMNQWKSQKTL
jgi:hypothetical protein